MTSTQPLPLLAEAIAGVWRRNREYALRLVGDLTDAQMLAQPVAGRRLNHPAWILSHLVAYAPIVTALLRGDGFADPIDHRHGLKSEVSDDPNEYLPRVALIEEFLRTHDQAQAALEQTTEPILSRPNPLERWRAKHPLSAHMVVTLMVKHEAFHLGQLSAWRRGMGLARVAM